jgi:DNA-binding response OmpR family regulator
MKILVVDDDLELRGLIGFALRQAGYLVIEAHDGLRALASFDQELPDLVVLDLNLPGLDGFEVCRRVRERSPAPILILSVRDGEEDEVKSLDSGADDYLTKPFSLRSLLAHVRALLRRGVARRSGGAAKDRFYEAGELTLDVENQAVRLRGAAPRRLTPLEYRLLQYLMVNARRTLSIERLINHVWGYQGAGDRRAVKQLVHRVRQKIESNPAEPQYILTVSGVGYVLQLSPADGAYPGLG